MNEKDVFATILENIQTKLSPQTFDAYFAELQIIGIQNSTLTIACKNAFTKQTIEGRFYNTLLNTIKNVLNDSAADFQLVIKAATSQETEKSSFSNLFSPTNFQTPNTNTSAFVPTQQTSFQQQPQQYVPAQQSGRSNSSEFHLNTKYTFDTFVVGSHNQLAHAAAIAIANNPGNAYNPFFIYGNVGLGKTHLMQSIGNEVLKKNSNAKILYSATETFLNEMVQSIRTQKNNQFREKYRALDILILDDIQFLSNKEGLQEEFFNTFNSLYQSGKQIILASDRPPGEISHLEDRIRSRFEGGLVADIKSPNIETRIAILQKKLLERNEFLPEPVLAVVAECIDTNIRELEGALLKISIHYQTSGNLSSDDVRNILGAKLIAKRKRVNPLDIMKTVCEHLQIELRDVKSSKRNYDISYARQICMYMLKDTLNLQLIKIAKHVGRKDHTTIMHGISKIEELIEKDPQTLQLVSELKFKINSN
jgi:chromosomal replication initiator protein